MPTPNDTILAVSSPPGRSARGLIRVSGPGVDAVLEELLIEAEVEPRELTPVRLIEPELPALLLRCPGPASYTGEDLAELQLPGNAALLDRVLHRAVNAPKSKARLADPGEFTFRAYTAGKLDLTQAEGVGATIAAVSDSQLAAAGLLRKGALGRTSEYLVDRLGNLLALVEAGIDFTDQEDVMPIAPDALHQQLSSIRDELSGVLSRSRSWGAIQALPRVVLAGPPSAGKSTLFNALLGRERAVIDPSSGTTRDALAEPLQLQERTGRPVEVMLIDLAGLDAGLLIDAVDQASQRAAHDAIKQADLVLRVTESGSEPILIDADAPMLDVISKCDRAESTTRGNDAAVRVSALEGSGLDVLRRATADTLADRAVSVQADLLALQPRHEQALQDAQSQIQSALDTLSPSLGTPGLPAIELLADAMRGALDALASLGGRLTPDEVIGRVFASFCVGK